MRVAAFTKYGRAAASTRQRLLQFLPALSAAGIEVEVLPLIGDDYVRSLATGGSYSRLAMIRSYARRFLQLLREPDYDLIWVYAELFPYLPAIFERLAFRAGKPLVYDFDDAFFVTYEDKPVLDGKIDGLIAGAAACCCGNPYLLDHARRLNASSIVLPTVVDTNAYRPLDAPPRPPAIGWIGSPSTWPYVRPLLPLIEQLCRQGEKRFIAVGAGHGADADRFDGMEVRHWTEHREVADIQAMDVGIMPLPDDPWARGKSGYKLVQFMACGLPVVASPVGVNPLIVENGKSGYLASSKDEWARSLGLLLKSRDLRSSLGMAGRERIVAHYSLEAQAPRVIQIFQEAVSRGRTANRGFARAAA